MTDNQDRKLNPIEWLTGPWTKENLWAWVKLIVIILAIRWALVDFFRVPSGSMEPTFLGHGSFARDDRIAVNKLAYGPRIPFTKIRLFNLADPKRWDIVVFRSVPEDAKHPILVKRVVGLPGERIHIADGKIHVNGKALDLPDFMPPDLWYTSPLDSLENRLTVDANGNIAFAQPYATLDRPEYGISPEDQYAVVPDNCYLVLGDNSAHSLDGRYFGWLPKDNILGRAFCIWWPLNRLRDLTGFSHTWWGKLLLFGIPASLIALELRARRKEKMAKLETSGD